MGPDFPPKSVDQIFLHFDKDGGKGKGPVQIEFSELDRFLRKRVAAPTADMGSRVKANRNLAMITKKVSGDVCAWVYAGGGVDQYRRWLLIMMMMMCVVVLLLPR